MPELLMLSQNANGLQEKSETFTHVIVEFLKWKREKRLGVLCLQDHNMHPARERDLKRLAKVKGITLLVTFGHADAGGAHHGGVLMMIDDSCLTFKKEVTMHPSLIRAEVEFGGRTR
jgi:exonuclease III